MGSWTTSGRGAPSPCQTPASPSARVALSPSNTAATGGSGGGATFVDTQAPRTSTNTSRDTNSTNCSSNCSNDENTNITCRGSGSAASSSSVTPTDSATSTNDEKCFDTRRADQPGPSAPPAMIGRSQPYSGNGEHRRSQQYRPKSPRKQHELLNTLPQQTVVPTSQHQLSDYRHKLAREMSARVNSHTPPPASSPFSKRPSPIEEEKAAVLGSPSTTSSPALPTDLPSTASSGTTSTASTDSTRTVRALDTERDDTAHTPSYPFPRMAIPGQMPFSPQTGSRSAHARSVRSAHPAHSTGNQQPKQHRPKLSRDESSSSFRSDQVLSSPSTPGSTMPFLPPGALRERQGRQTESFGGRDPPRDASPEQLDFSTPNLYELALALSSEPGLDAWWNTVVQIVTDWYKAERVALAIPADSTDVENMPWGQKATFNAEEKDDMSLGYIGRDGSIDTCAALDPSLDIAPVVPASAAFSLPMPPATSSITSLISEPALRRPSLVSRYSYTTYEEQTRQKTPDMPKQPERPPTVPQRPPLSRSQTAQPVPTPRSDIPKADAPEAMLPPKSYASLNHAALKKHDATDAPGVAVHARPSLQPSHAARGRVLPVLQALDYEADPLIDQNGVQRVLDRGHVVALTRSYPYMARMPTAIPGPKQSTTHESEDKILSADAIPSNITPGGSQGSHHEHSIKLSALLGNSSLPSTKGIAVRPSAPYMRRLAGTSIASKLEDAKPPRAKSPQYEEYEQIPPSPWSQSPAPSPAVRHDPNENPFFKDVSVDEESFNPGPTPESYMETQPPEAIGMDNAWTVLHIPLYHPLSSKATLPFRLDRTKMERRASPRRDADKSTDASPGVSPSRPKQMPIAILSILCPIIPYPSSLRHSLQYLAPHMAASFSLCVHYSNLEAEVNGLHRRHGELDGFGGIDTEGHPLRSASIYSQAPYLHPDDPIALRSQGGSLASFSDYSARSRSVAGSPGGTPSWDSTMLNMFLERRTNTGSGISPSIASLAGGDGYFGMRSGYTGPFALPATTPGTTSSSGGGGCGSCGAGLRGRKNSVSHIDKHICALRQPDVNLPAQEERDSPALSDSTAGAAVPGALPSPSVGRADDMQKGSETTSEEPGARSSAIDAMPPSSTKIQTGQLALGTVLGDTPNPTLLSPSHPVEPKKKTVDRDIASDGSRHSFSPIPSTPCGAASHQRHSRSHHQSSRSYSGHSLLHSFGADFASTFPSLPPSGTIAVKGASATMQLPTSTPSRAPSLASSNPVDMPPPSDRLKSLILDSLPAHVFVAMPQTGAIVWVNSRYLAYRGQTVEGLAEDPWGSLHPDDRDEYLKAWSHSVRTGDQFSRTVRIRRFDGYYRWFQARAVASRDRRNSIMQFLGSYMDIHDQHIAELKAARQEEIEASEAKHRILANLIPQIIFTANEEEGVTFANEQWLSYTGQSFQDLLGLGFLDNVHPDDLAKCSFMPVPAHLQERRKRLRETISCPFSARGEGNVHERPREGAAGPRDDGDEGLSELAELAKRGIILVTTDDNGRPSYTTEVRLRSKTGEYRWHLVRCVETGTVDFGKGYNSYFGSATDINDHKLLETKLKEAMDSKTRFLSNMSHEIRTPLIGISGMVSFLQDTTLNEEQRDYTNTIQTSANSLLMIINDILDLSKVDAGMMKLSFEWFHTRSLIEDVNELVSTMAIAKGLELNYIVDTDVPSWVKGDRVRIRQVLLNVIGNAIKFTAQGEVFSRCRVVESSSVGADQIELEFIVTDTGRGFTKEEADLIFKPFSQIDGSSTRQHGGSGLGLVISRQLVELHGGKMNGTAVPGQGSTFTFTAVFHLPTELDHPDGLKTPSPEANISASNVALSSSMGFATPAFVDPVAVVAAAAASATGITSAGFSRPSITDTDTLPTASPATTSSDSSVPSLQSNKSAPFSGRSSSTPSISTGGLLRFSEAARASGPDPLRLTFRASPANSRRPSYRLPSRPSLCSSDTPITSSGITRNEAAEALNTDVTAAEATAAKATTAEATMTDPTTADATATDTTATNPGSTDSTTTEPMTIWTAAAEAMATDVMVSSNIEVVGQSQSRLLMFSILIVCPQTHSREATAKHIETTLPKGRPFRIVAVATMEEAQSLISASKSRPFTHVVINLPSPKQILRLVDQLDQSTTLEMATVLVLSDSVQRQAVNALAAGTRYEQRLAEAKIMYIYKPVKPSRFAVIFDPERESDISIDRNRSSAQQLVESQKQSYLDLEQRMGNKGYKVLLVEDNMVNQKVLSKYLLKVGVEVDLAADGVECTDTVFSRPHEYYSLILCDLHMPRKDGYQACREIREWEAHGDYKKRIPMIALSANVMSDVHDKCVEAGFSKYITKPVDFINLSRVLADFF